jgi:hypothetical protein
LAPRVNPPVTSTPVRSGPSSTSRGREITGTTISNGDPGPGGILGAKLPHLFEGGWRFFYTQQRGDNVTYEVIPSSPRQGESDD